MEKSIYKSPESELDLKKTGFNGYKITPGSLYKLLFIGFFFGLGPLLLINGVYDLVTGSESIISFNEQKLIGVSGFIGTLIFIPIMSLMLASLTWCFCALGLWLYGLFKPVDLKFE